MTLPTRAGSPPADLTCTAATGPVSAVCWPGSATRRCQAQELALDVALEVDGRGRYVHPTVVLLVPRRGGKTLSVAGVLADRAVNAAGSAGYVTSCKGPLASQWFRDDFVPLLDPFGGAVSHRFLTSRESVRFANRSTVAVFPPTRDALHSRFSDLVVIDEAWGFDLVRGEEILQGALPTPENSAGRSGLDRLGRG